MHQPGLKDLVRSEQIAILQRAKVLIRWAPSPAGRRTTKFALGILSAIAILDGMIEELEDKDASPKGSSEGS